MTTEQKAKAYDEALERAREYWETDNDNTLDIKAKGTMEYLFPELTESEGERIRKEIISFLHLHHPQFIGERKKEKWIAWLEKQGELKSIWHNEDEEPKRDSLILLIMQSGTPIVAKIIEPNHTFNHGERWAYIDDLLEKQGKTFTKKDIDDAYLKGVCDAKQELEKQGQKKCSDDLTQQEAMDIAVAKCFEQGKQKPINDTDEDIVEAVKDTSVLDMIEQNSAWSEEDEEYLRRAIKAAKEIYPATANWLKSLKERIGG